MNKPIIYLAGAITGVSYGDATDWREQVTRETEGMFTCFSPMRGKHYLSKETSIGDSYENSLLSSQRGIFARDSFDCMRCDVLFVNLLGATRVSIGTVMEIAWAQSRSKPIILVIESEGNLHDHSMIREACPLRVDTIDDGIWVLKSLLLP